MRLLWVSLCFLLICTSPAYAVTLAEVQSHLAAVDVLRASYRQTRVVIGLNEPLESSGTLLLARNTGLVWSQEEPFQVQYVITDEIFLQQFPGQPHKVKKKADNRELFKFVGFVSSLFTEQGSSLEQSFDIDFAMLAGEAWTITLTPRAANIRKVFTTIVLAGKQLVEDVEINEASGNKTLIHFSDMDTSPALLSADEKLYFQN